MFNPDDSLNLTSSVQTCKSLNLKNYSSVEAPLACNKIPTRMDDAKCVRFKCNTNVETCDNVKPTNYSGPDPPCCSHILRDMARLFNEEMCRIGLDYLAAFGTLLGFTRSSRVIPWTADLDHIIRGKKVANAMVSHWDAKRTGMAHLFQGINRICITADFGEGGVVKWKKKMKVNEEQQLWSSGFPHIDVYIAKMVSTFSFPSAMASLDLINERWKDGGVLEIKIFIGISFRPRRWWCMGMTMETVAFRKT